MKKNILKSILAAASLVDLQTSQAGEELTVGAIAPTFVAKTQDGKTFDLQSRKGKWTVLFFYPKADTPGCTKQACAFSDSVDKIRAQDAEVYGISADTIEAQLAFHTQHKMKLNLIADPDAKIIKQYGTKMPVLKVSKRWTFIIDPELKVRSIRKDIEPLLDAQEVSQEIAKLKSAK
ncbi:MAG: peroxiredoxin [Bdellovibrionaceae bacterium]|nr:peroxiredoxin [Pseudobdellovibrionaceae bacterium]